MIRLRLDVVLVLVLVLVLAPATLAGETRNVILFIGDGMGPTQVNLGRLVNGKPLSLEAIETLGLARSDSLTGPVTDSAGAITAIASGVKTRNRSLGVDGEGRPVRSVADDLAAIGYATGVVTTTRVTHATPAGFYGHSARREDEVEIASQLIAGTLSVALGGGAHFFPAEGQARLREKGFAVVRDRASLRAAAADGLPRVVGLFAEGHLSFEVDRPEAEPPLAEMTDCAIRLLSRDKDGKPTRPFFLMVEGGRIDQACHGHDAATAAKDVIAFDAAVRVGLEFAAGDKRTLVLVTADHATGGMSVSEKVDLDGLRRSRASAQKVLERALAEKRGAERLRDLVRQSFGFDLTEEEAEDALTKKYNYAVAGQLAHTISARFGVHFAFPLAVQETFDSTEGHDATLVSIYASGPGAARFAGTIDNTDIAKRIRELTLPREGSRDGEPDGRDPAGRKLFIPRDHR